jgi:hypothetical protein
MKKSITFLALLFVAISSFGQLDSAFTLTGSVDTYFRRNLNSSNDPTNVKTGSDGNVTSSTLAPSTSFANLPGFALGMANLVAGYSKDKVSLVADLAFGPRGKDASFNIGPGLNIVNQLNISYAVSDKVKFTLGKFNTFLGYEVISPVANKNYSCSYMFSWGPFSHTGLKSSFDLGGGFSAVLGVMNPTDYTDFNPDNSFVGGGQLGYSNGNSFIYLNTLAGNDLFQVDITANHKISDKFSVGINATEFKDNFSGAALYSTLGFSDVTDLSLRLEYFKDKGVGALIGTDPSVVDATFSLNIKKGNFRLVPEFRIDLFKSSDNVKPVITNAITNKTADKLSSFVLAAIANF